MHKIKYLIFVLMFIILPIFLALAHPLAPNDGPGWKAEDWDENRPQGYNWGLEFIKLPSAWDFTTGNKDVKIGIIDLGFDITHEDLKDNIIPYAVSYPHEHGTHVAGIIGAKGNNGIGIAGTMWDVTILPYSAKVPFMEKTSSFLAIAKMWSAIMQGAKIINYSAGIDHKTMQSAERENLAWKILLLDRVKNKIFIFAAGELGVDDKYSSPSSISSERDNIISVVDTNSLGEYIPDSNYGEITVAAPGVLINSTLPGNSYGDKFGTSFAAPFVSGLAGLIYSKAEELGKDITAAEVKNLIIQGAINGNEFVSGPDGHQIPIINAYESLKLLVVSPPTEWSLPETIYDSPEAIQYRAVTSDNSGNLHMIWMKSVWKDTWYTETYYTKRDETGWSEPVIIASSSGSFGTQPGIISDSLGHLHVAFEGRQDNTVAAFYMMYDGTEWSEPVNISKNVGDPNYLIRITSDNNDNLHVVWSHLSASPTVFYVNKTNETWSEPLAISPPAAGSYCGSLFPLIVSDSNNNLHVVMSTCLSAYPTTISLFYTKFNGLEWSEPVNLDISSGGNSGGADFGITTDKFNHPHIIASSRIDGVWGMYHIYWNGTVWTTPVDISGTGNFVQLAHLTTDDLGVIHGIWHEQITEALPEQEWQIVYSSYDGNKWSEAEIIPNISIHCAPIDIVADIFDRIHVFYEYTQNALNYLSHVWR